VAFIAVLLISGCSAKPVDTSDARLFRVTHGESARDIARALTDQGFIRRPWSFLIWVKLPFHHRHSIRPGAYPISPSDTGYSILQLMLKGPPSARLTFPEGWNAKQIATLLELHNVIPAATFLQKVDKEKLEGYLFPDTYVFEQGSDLDTVMHAMRRRFNQMLPPDWAERQKALHLSDRQLVTLASIVERETRVPEERPLIAGVFLNRLHKHMRLETDPTVQFALGVWKPHLTYHDLEVESPYNTYRHAGLPPGPICNPGAAALDAAAHPAQTDMLFFVATGDGTHRFSQNYQQHLKVQREQR